MIITAADVSPDQVVVFDRTPAQTGLVISSIKIVLMS
jgi:hypothetical protein